nr:hypothetical protein BHI3_12200 [Bacteriovorax sp. HI3]
MKVLSIVSLLMAFSFNASAGFDLGKLSNLDGLSGVGRTSAANKDEQNTICSVEVDANDNYLKVVMPLSLFDELSVSGDLITETSSNREGIVLKTDKYDPGKSNLCGDWKKASYAQDILQVTNDADKGKTVTLKKIFKCGFSSHEVFMTCKLSK